MSGERVPTPFRNFGSCVVPNFSNTLPLSGSYHVANSVPWQRLASCKSAVDHQHGIGFNIPASAPISVAAESCCSNELPLIFRQVVDDLSKRRLLYSHMLSQVS
jgi:hypothetical protein